MERCAICGRPIMMNEPSYYAADPAGGELGIVAHSRCGDLFGIKRIVSEKDARIAALEAQVRMLTDTRSFGGN